MPTATTTDITNIFNNYYMQVPPVEYFEIPISARQIPAHILIMPTITKLDVEETFQLYHGDPTLQYFQIPKEEEIFYIDLTLDRLGAFIPPGGGGGANYISTFIDSDARFTGNVIRFTHLINSPVVDVVVKNNDDVIIAPDGLVIVDNNNVDVDLTSYKPLTGLWYVFINL